MSSDSKPTIYICYGFCEGPQLGRQLASALQVAGFQVVLEADQADIFLGHSGGCLLVPSGSKARLTVLIGIPYWPGRSILSALYKKNRREFRASRADHTQAWWWNKLKWNSLYFWNMRQNFAMLKNKSAGLSRPPSNQTLCVRNRNDDCCTEAIWRLSSLTNTAFLSLPGEHDDLWMHPGVYAGIIKAYYGANVLASTKAE